VCFRASKSAVAGLLPEYVEAESRGKGDGGECWRYHRDCPKSLFKWKSRYERYLPKLHSISFPLNYTRYCPTAHLEPVQNGVRAPLFLSDTKPLFNYCGCCSSFAATRLFEYITTALFDKVWNELKIRKNLRTKSLENNITANCVHRRPEDEDTDASNEVEQVVTLEAESKLM
jgi:hypothetical protein